MSAKTELTQKRARIAVIGGGAGGLAAAWRLSQKHDVTLFESGPKVGGHAHSVVLTDQNGSQRAVDTAFLIFNDRTYPNFVKFIDSLGVQSHVIRAEMSSCFSDSHSDFAYTLGAGFRPFWAAPSIILRREFRQVLLGLRRFRREAAHDLNIERDLRGMTVGEYLKNYDRAFVEHFVWPLTSAIWSLADGQMRDYPITTLLEYFDNHQLIRGKSERRWRTFQGSSRVYTEAFTRQFGGKLKLGCSVQSVERTAQGVRVHLPGAAPEEYDHVVLATHADTSLKLLQNPTAAETKLLGAWRYKDNPVTLHHDVQVLHADPRRWGSWNMRRYGDSYRISYYLNRLQNLSFSKPVILTLGEMSVKEDQVVQRFMYHHPVFDLQSVATQKELPELNGKDRIFYCGSYFGHGFHEDAVASAAQVAALFGC